MELDISGARIFFTLPIDVPVLGPLRISETMVVSWIVMILITGLCIWLTHDLKEENISKRQAVAELIVEKANSFVIGNMGEKFRYLIPFVAALFATSVVSNLISLIGLRSPTADLSTEAAWAVVVFIMITAQKIKTSGFGGYLKGFTTPIAVMTPFNSFRAGYTCQYGVSSFRKYPFRCGNQWPDLWGTGSRKFRASGPDPGCTGRCTVKDTDS